MRLRFELVLFVEDLTLIHVENCAGSSLFVRYIRVTFLIVSISFDMNLHVIYLNCYTCISWIETNEGYEFNSNWYVFFLPEFKSLYFTVSRKLQKRRNYGLRTYYIKTEQMKLMHLMILYLSL